LLFRHTQVALYTLRLCVMSAIESSLLSDNKVPASEPPHLNYSNSKIIGDLHKFMIYKSDKSTTQKDAWFILHFLTINSISVFPTTSVINVLERIRKCNWFLL
jgi:hypothetical protein